MIKKDINQNDILNLELLNILDYNYIYSDKPIQRIKTKPTLENSLPKLEILKKKIEAIQNCDLKKNASKIVFGDGDIQSPIMIIGEAALSFLGLGIKPPMTSWGLLLTQLREVQTLKHFPWLISPALFLVVSVLCYNFIGDALRDVNDPHSR